MKEIVIISGKGGTGKTSLTASYAYLGGPDIVVADCDVDAADMHLLMQPDFARGEDFYSGELAKIHPDNCTQCGKCAEICRFDAISVIDGIHTVDPLSCEGCGYCARICPTDTIENVSLNVGKWYISSIKTGSIMVHARLGIGADNSGKLVAKVKNEARIIPVSWWQKLKMKQSASLKKQTGNISLWMGPPGSAARWFLRFRGQLSWYWLLNLQFRVYTI